MTIQLTSSAFKDGEKVPKKYTGDGEDLSPPLAWSGVPQEARELALICDDPDAPTPQPWVHWVIYKLPPTLSGLPAGLPKTPTLNDPAGAMQGKNSWPSGQTVGYRGPAPPKGYGPHRYFFRLYALNAPLNVKPGQTKDELLKAMEKSIVAQGQLMGTYER